MHYKVLGTNLRVNLVDKSFVDCHSKDNLCTNLTVTFLLATRREFGALVSYIKQIASVTVILVGPVISTYLSANVMDRGKVSVPGAGGN